MTPDKPFIVAVTGHRPNRILIGEEEVVRRLKWVLTGLRAGSSDRVRIAISALAEGADRLFAAEALNLGYRLHAALPFHRDAYMTTFNDASANSDFRAMLERADKVTELSGSLAATDAAYEEVGRLIVEEGDVTLAVWDGKPAAGRGGTPETIDYALQIGKPVVWIDASVALVPRLLMRPRVGTGRVVNAPLSRFSLISLAESS